MTPYPPITNSQFRPYKKKRVFATYKICTGCKNEFVALNPKYIVCPKCNTKQIADIIKMIKKKKFNKSK